MANTAGSVENFSAGEAQDEAGDGGIRAWCVHVGDRDGEGRFAASSNSACALLDLRPPSLWVMSLPSLSPSCAVGVGVTPCPIFSAEVYSRHEITFKSRFDACYTYEVCEHACDK
ncbi:uncharacterized protein [Physcomitrium patens]|uniref:Uncharacterized protein n=3 Tax=Physcomitrium patens TaxID=3218 RepID=A0A2K1K5P0_PHYPA|nr:hypothetical protein PHYPA_010978 [Physcomitrium patens]